jgi:arabinogalactan endo-1,4-beta-galactosidase
MRKLLLLLLFTEVTTMVSAQKYVGGDISMLTKYEDAGVVYKDKNGNAVQPLPFFKEQGLNAMRVRLFVDPSQDNDKAVCQDLEYVKALGKRIKDQRMAFMLDFHYSDTWADPGKQWTPDAWKTLSDAELYEKIYEYSKDCLQQLKEAGATPDFIQTGNEISYGMIWGTKASVGSNTVNRCYTNSPEANWTRFFNLLKKAGQACREECPNAKIIIHSERTPKPSVLTDFFDRMKNAEIDYDIIGLSYYPEHHGNLATLETALTSLENKNYGKDIMIVETGYSYAWSIGGEYDYTATYPYTEEGQRQFTADLIAKLNGHSSVKGLFWWWPEDNGNKGVTSSWWNAALYNHNTGQPYAAFYELKNFNDGSAGMQIVRSTDNKDGAWYTLDGRKLNGTPQTKGIYINNNKKVIVR